MSGIVTNDCAYCGQQGATKKCSRCLTAFYCSKECQKSAWKAHKPLCRVQGSQKTNSNNANELYFEFDVPMAHPCNVMVYSYPEDSLEHLKRCCAVLNRCNVKTTIQTAGVVFPPGQTNGMRTLLEKNGRSEDPTCMEWADGIHQFLTEKIRSLLPQVQNRIGQFGLRYEVSLLSEDVLPQGVYETPNTLFSYRDLKSYYEGGHKVFIGYLSLQHDGVWKAIYDKIRRNQCTEAELSMIPYGQMLVLPPTLVHSGGIPTGFGGNKHLQFIVYAVKGGSPADIPTLGKRYLKVDTEQNSDGTFATYKSNSRWNSGAVQRTRGMFSFNYF